MNPLLPRYFFMADTEARVMPDGRLYLYGSQDVSGNGSYCCKEYRVFSTDDPKMEHWVDHGVSLSNTAQDPGIPFSPDTILYAPDCIYKDGKYYLYVCGENAFEAVLESDKPEGPFGNARPIVGADNDSIDPAVFIDDDGQAYLFWGQFRLKGAKLMDDMATLDTESLSYDILTEMEHGFHEGASIRKRNGKYYMVYTDVSRGRATCMSYAVADSPLGPYKKGGVIIDNYYCDPKTWNDHGSIEEFCGQWYVFYHTSTQNSHCSRRVCAEPIYFAEDGSIKEVEMTSIAASDPIDGFVPVDASLACRVKGNVYIAPDPAKDRFARDITEILTNGGGGNWIEDWAEYRYIDLREGADRWTVRACGEGKISVLVEDFGTVGSVEVRGEAFSDFTGKLTRTVSGVKAVWLLLEGKNLNVDQFVFARS